MKPADMEWVEPETVQVSPGLLQAAGNDPFLAGALARRGILSPEKAAAFLDPSKYVASPASELPGMDAAVQRIQRAIADSEMIGIWGDFDADGQTSTAILFSTLQALGAKVIYYIPVRARESHGIALPALDKFIQRGVTLVVTCDTGVTAHDAVEFGTVHGVDFIITDHHTLPPELPRALAVINPQRLPADHPLRPLCGAGTAYKLAEALFAVFDRSTEAGRLQDLAAIGTIADLVSLTGDNRYLVQRGLEQIRANPRPAIKAILAQSEINYTQITEEHVSFVIAPRLNALGRLADANPAVPFLLAADATEAAPLSAEIETLNSQRKLLCDQVFQGALAQLKAEPDLLDSPVLVLNHPNWPGGVIGLAASRLVEVYQKPALVIACPPGEPGRGSARSVEGINITAALAANQDMLLTFGGHPMAAGFAIDPQKISQFRAALGHTVSEMSTSVPVSRTLAIDHILPLDRLTLDLVETLDRLAPYGPGNPPFKMAARSLIIRSYSPIGKTREHLQIIVEDPGGVTRKVIWWQGAGNPLPEERFDLAFSVRASNFRGERSVQIEWIQARTIDDELQSLSEHALIQALDFRHDPDPRQALDKLQGSGPWLVYHEGEKTPDIPGVDRYHLGPAPALAFWSIPPGLDEFQLILGSVRPSQVALFGISTSEDQAPLFLQRLGGLIRFAISRRGGQATIQELASATSQREATIWKGIDWWIARGEITMNRSDTGITFHQDKNASSPTQSRIEQELKSLLAETAAFRSYFLRAEPQHLLK